ncbi:cingulin-like protein 1 isoform X2 [Echinops telfairi]|uniref:Cingulin-like protein 1 isoform X2 n=1 Tax=Echinops telfairi TaxID=9371 RepID=A0AC55CSE3_ECHTE|nr:cingulin-like protein 1 isoform X2 [Echinops telfairi]
MELYFGEYQHVQQEYGVHLRLASDETRKSRNLQQGKAGSYGVSIRVQGIDGHPYIVLNNTERCLAGTSLSENGLSFAPPMINNPPPHASNGPGLQEEEEDDDEDAQLPENPYAPRSAPKTPKQATQLEGKNGVLEHGPTRPAPALNFQRPPERLPPYDPERSELNPQNHRPPESTWFKTFTPEATKDKKPGASFPKPTHVQPPSGSPPLEEPAETPSVTAIPLCASVMVDGSRKHIDDPRKHMDDPRKHMDDPRKHASLCVNVRSRARDGAAEEAPSPSSRLLAAHGPHAHPEARKPRPDVLPFRRQDSAGPAPDDAGSRRSSSSCPTPTSANALYKFLLDDQAGALRADSVNRHENRRYIPFLPGTGRDIDTGSIPGVDELIEKFDGKPGLPRRGRAGKRNRIHPEDRKRSRSVDSAFPFGLRGSSEYLSEFSRNLGKSSEHLLRPSQVCPPKAQAQEHRGKHVGGRTFAKLQQATRGAPCGSPKSPQQNQELGKAHEDQASPGSTALPASPLPAQGTKEEEVKTAAVTVMLQNRAAANSPDSGAKKISVKRFPSTSDTQATPDLLKGQQEFTQQTNEETAKQILYNYLKEGSTDNDDATKRKVNLVFEKIQTLKSRAAGSGAGNNQASNSSSEIKDLLEQKSKLTKEVAELQRQLQLEVKNQQAIKEERERMGAALAALQSQHAQQVEVNSGLQQRLEKSEEELCKTLEELFQVKMEREQHQTEIRDLQDQLSEMHDELDSAKQSEDGEKGALIEELLEAKQDLQDLLIAKEEQEDLLRRRERELTALKGALKEEVASHDQEMDKLKEQYDAELQALRESVEEATKGWVSPDHMSRVCTSTQSHYLVKQLSMERFIHASPVLGSRRTLDRRNVEVLASRSSPSAHQQVGAAVQEENERLRARVGELEQSVTQLQKQLSDLEGEEAKAKETLRKCEGERRQLEEALMHSRKEEKEASTAHRSLAGDLQDAQRTLSRVTQEQKQLSEKLKDEIEQKEQLKRMKNEMENERWHLDKTIEKLQKEMADIVEASRTSTLELQNQLDEYKENNRRELTEMQRQLKEKTLEAEKSRLTALKMQEEMRLLEEALRDHQRAQDEAVTKRQLLEQMLKDLEYELEARSHLKDDRGRLVKQMEDKVSQLEMELEEERNNSDLLSDRISRSREQIEQMRIELLQEKAVRQDLECDKISLERQNKDLKSRIIHLEGSYRSSKEGLVAQMETRISELEDRLESEERDRANLQLSNRRLERKVKELVLQVDDEHLSLTDQKDQLSLRLKAMKRQVEEAEEEIDRLESSKKKLQRELEEQMDVNEQLQGQLNSMKKDLRLKKFPSKVLDDMDDDDDLSTDGGSLYEAPLSYNFPKDCAATSQI